LKCKKLSTEGEAWVQQGVEQAVNDLLDTMPEAASSSNEERTLLRRKARCAAVNKRIFHVATCQIFAEMLGTVCHTDNDYIEDGHEQTVRFTLTVS
jgi:hypothetical protein